MSNSHDETKHTRREDFQQALRSMGSYMDITVDDLMTITQRAEQFASLRVTEAMDVARAMSQPVHTVHPQTSLCEAAHLMVSNKISGLPVVDDDGHLVGIITEADFLRALGISSHHVHHNMWQTLESLFSHLARHGEVEAPDDPVMTHMEKNVVCVSPDQNLHDVIDVMKHNNVKRVVVCDKDHRVVGMITRSNLVRIFFGRYADGCPK